VDALPGDVTDPAYDPVDSMTPDPSQDFVLSPSDRPTEPFTSGLSFGTGPDVPKYGFENNADLLKQVADKLSADPNAPKEVRGFIDRVNRGF
jgi:hypothetical protein